MCFLFECCCSPHASHACKAKRHDVWVCAHIGQPVVWIYISEFPVENMSGFCYSENWKRSTRTLWTKRTESSLRFTMSLKKEPGMWGPFNAFRMHDIFWVFIELYLWLDIDQQIVSLTLCRKVSLKYTVGLLLKYKYTHAHTNTKRLKWNTMKS